MALHRVPGVLKGAVTGAAATELYGIYEIAAVTNANSYSNKYDYTVVELSVLFAGISGAANGVSRTVKGFHDGGSTWRCRFMPHLTGGWQYTYSWTGSGSHPTPPAGPHGTFTCTDTGIYGGPLSVAADRTRFFQNARGQPFHARSYGTHHMLWWTGSTNIATEAEYLKTRITTYLVARGHNFTMFNGCGRRTWQSDQVGRNPESNYSLGWFGANSTSVHPSVDQFSPSAFAGFEAVIEHMRDNGIYTILFTTLYDQWSKTGSDPDGSLGAMTTAQEQRLARYFLARLGAFYNLFGLSPTWEWFDSGVHTIASLNTLMNFIQSSDPYGRLLAAHDNSHSQLTPWPGFSMTQSDISVAGSSTTLLGGARNAFLCPANGAEQAAAADSAGDGGVAYERAHLPDVRSEWHWVTDTGYRDANGWPHPVSAAEIMRGVWGVLMAGAIPMPDWWNGWRNAGGASSGDRLPDTNFNVGENRITWAYDLLYGVSNGATLYREHDQANGLAGGPGTNNKACSCAANREYLLYSEGGGAMTVNLAGVVTPGATVIQDSFTTGADQTLETHVPDTGTSWAVGRRWTLTTESLTVVAATDRVGWTGTLRTSATGIAYVASPAPASADYEVSIRIAALAGITADTSLTLLARWASGSSYYGCSCWPRYGSNQGWLEIVRKTGLDTHVSLGSTETIRFMPGDVLGLRVIGTSIAALRNGVPVITATDANLTAAGQAGFGLGAGVDTSNSADLNPNLLLDDFQTRLITAGSNTTFNCLWFNPATGTTQTGTQVTGGASRALGTGGTVNAPSTASSPFGATDSVALLRATGP